MLLLHAKPLRAPVLVLWLYPVDTVSLALASVVAR
jgi:hypothetical protein